MPKTVDREEQRRQIGAALLHLVSERGLDEVSVRTVAAATGRSPGAVQKYFRTKDEMLTFAAELAGERVEHRMAGVNTALPPRQALRELILTTLPVDADRRAEATAQLAFAVHAAHHPRLAAIRRQVDRDVREALAAWLESAGHGPDASAVADAVIALSDGLALRMLYAPQEHEQLLAALERALDALVPEGG
ncbi:TetR/AcrR family transcriptional regulator [Streptomyces sp. NPDC019990]|uniref:TetR/AcrR family transcriptional regulator n=1 Tax=Streptomyces sp. NPDC019990 TaxID=3154693 RepID=UPI00340AFDC8